MLDGSFVKLREINLAWQLPKTWAGKLRAQRLNVGLYARNVAFLHTGQPHFDPEFQYTPHNADQGWEVMQYPAARTIGVQFNAAF